MRFSIRFPMSMDTSSETAAEKTIYFFSAAVSALSTALRLHLAHSNYKALMACWISKPDHDANPLPTRTSGSWSFLLGVEVDASMPCMCRSPKKDWFQPVKGNQAIGAGTPMLMPIMPALKCCLNSRAA